MQRDGPTSLSTGWPPVQAGPPPLPPASVLAAAVERERIILGVAADRATPSATPEASLLLSTHPPTTCPLLRRLAAWGEDKRRVDRGRCPPGLWGFATIGGDTRTAVRDAPLWESRRRRRSTGLKPSYLLSVLCLSYA